jgi:hypothetical protein
VNRWLDKPAEGLRKLEISSLKVREGIYSWTQATLRAQGIKELMVYRGVKGDYAAALLNAAKSGGGTVGVSTRGLSSWSTFKETGIAWANPRGGYRLGARVGVVLSHTISASEVFAHYSGFSDAGIPHGKMAHVMEVVVRGSTLNLKREGVAEYVKPS